MPYRPYIVQSHLPTLNIANKLICMGLCLSMFATACSAANDPSETSPTLSDEIQSVDNAVAEITGNNYCETDQDCALLPIGERACGGPSNYVIYSRRLGDEALNKLQELSAESVALAKKANKESGYLSTCQMYPIPTISCVENKCVKNESSYTPN